jgi:hypothetical protein
MMEIQLSRRTGFYGMGSPIQLQIDGKKKQSLAHNQSVLLEVDPPFTMQVSFYWLKSPVYTITHPSKQYVIMMNLLLLQMYPLLFLASGVSTLYVSHFLYRLFVILGMIGFFFYIKNKAYVIKEEDNGQL